MKNENSNPTQAQAILKWLQSGRSISALGALKKWGCFRLAARIRELIKAGHDIQSDRVEIGGKHFSSYKLIVKK